MGVPGTAVVLLLLLPVCAEAQMCNVGTPFECDCYAQQQSSDGGNRSCSQLIDAGQSITAVRVELRSPCRTLGFAERSLKRRVASWLTEECSCCLNCAHLHRQHTRRTPLNSTQVILLQANCSIIPEHSYLVLTVVANFTASSLTPVAVVKAENLAIALHNREPLLSTELNSRLLSMIPQEIKSTVANKSTDNEATRFVGSGAFWVAIILLVYVVGAWLASCYFIWCRKRRFRYQLAPLEEAQKTSSLNGTTEQAIITTGNNTKGTLQPKNDNPTEYACSSTATQPTPRPTSYPTATGDSTTLFVANGRTEEAKDCESLYDNLDPIG